jgi:hypothetical protein
MTKRYELTLSNLNPWKAFITTGTSETRSQISKGILIPPYRMDD